MKTREELENEVRDMDRWTLEDQWVNFAVVEEQWRQLRKVSVIVGVILAGAWIISELITRFSG